MRFSMLIPLISIAASVTAQTLRGPLECAPAGAYTLCQDLLGEGLNVGYEVSTVLSADGNNVSWRTTWDWEDLTAEELIGMEGHARVTMQHNTAKGVQLANLISVPTTWQWEYENQSNSMRADVSYDIWTGSSAVGKPASSASSYEIMISLSGNDSIWPVGSQVSTGIGIAGHTWNVWKGPKGKWEVVAFASAFGDITDFNADLKDFFDYLQKHNGLPSEQYVQAIRTGAEPSTGSASLLTNNFNVALNV